VNVLSLFSGIGGLELGLERVGMRTVGQVEINQFCQRVLAKHWPEVPRHDDVRTTADWWQTEPRPRVDVVAGGPPCTPFSPAGLQLGVGDERWGWPWMADVIRAVRPDYVLLENVPGILRHRDAFGTILADLASLGFDAEWDVLTACALGATHRRRRVLLVGYPSGPGLQGLHEPGDRDDLQPAPRNVWRSWAPEPEMARVANGVPRRLVRDPIHAFGNAVVPAVAEFVGSLIVRHHAGRAAA
jgi:DNA (cytosine-5)-methyltransferase 1